MMGSRRQKHRKEATKMRFFWKTKISEKGVLTKSLFWTIPQSCPEISLYPVRKTMKTKQTDMTNLLLRTKRNVSLSPSLQGSITAETAFVLPLFVFFCVQLMSVISLIQLHSALTSALHQEVSKAALRAYALDQGGESGYAETERILEENLIKSRVLDRAGREYLDHSMIKGGSSGIRILYTPKTDRQDTVDIILTYQIRPMTNILGFSGFSMASRCRMKAWTGYRLEEKVSLSEKEEELVYITPTGSVYHKSRNCTHLALSVRPVETDSLGVLRNEDGGKYYPCEHCGSIAGGIVFLTDQGNRYHTSLFCSGLKRTIYTVAISQTGGRVPCRRCSAAG